MPSKFSIAMAQLNPTVGDIPGNCELVRQARAQALTQGADLLVCAELAVTGYPLEDLVLKPFLVERAQAAVETLAAETGDGGPAVVVTAPWCEDGKVYNAALLLADGKVQAARYKCDLPNYGVFDEKRVFAAGPSPEPVEFRGIKFGLPICEDIWAPGICAALKEAGAEILLVANGSPFESGKGHVRVSLVKARVAETGLPLMYVNQVGGQDELVFDGASFVVNVDGELAVRAPALASAVITTHWRKDAVAGWTCLPGELCPELGPHEEIYGTMMVGLGDYVTKNGFPGVVLGLSGGIDSAISAAVAVDVLGADRVHCVMMPSRYTSQESLDDARAVADLLGVRLDTIAIEPAVTTFAALLGPIFGGRAPDLTEENIQSRIRGLLLMAISNKLGYMVLTTGNKSEMSVGYATLYGDMCGGYSVLKDLYKTTVFELCEWRNAHKPAQALGPTGLVMPQRVIDKPPSAELRPDQKDEDSLPPYAELDAILHCLVEDEAGVAEAEGRGLDPATTRRIWKMLDLAEYKRRQAPPGVKVTRRAFGRDRRYPITNRLRTLI